MSANDSPGKKGWVGLLGDERFSGFVLAVLVCVIGWLIYQIDKDRRLAERSDPLMVEIRQIFDRAIEDGVVSAVAQGNYTITGQGGRGYLIRYTLPDGHDAVFLVSLGWEGRWFFSGGEGERDEGFVRDRLRAE